MSEQEWVPVWQDLPADGQQVIVKVLLRDGEVKHDIATYYIQNEKPSWSAQFWNTAVVAAWCELPSE